MSDSVRIDLENKIFVRAQALGTQIEALGGGWFAASSDVQLNALLGVYNAHFRAENLRRFCTPQEELEPWKNYVLARVYPPGAMLGEAGRVWKFEWLMHYEKNKI